MVGKRNFQTLSRKVYESIVRVHQSNQTSGMFCCIYPWDATLFCSWRLCGKLVWRMELYDVCGFSCLTLPTEFGGCQLGSVGWSTRGISQRCWHGNPQPFYQQNATGAQLLQNMGMTSDIIQKLAENLSWRQACYLCLFISFFCHLLWIQLLDREKSEK